MNLHRMRLSATLLALPGLAAAAGPDSALLERQNDAMIVWRAGDYDRGIKALESIYTDFPSEQRGKNSLIHIGLQLEGRAVLEARTYDETISALEKSRRYLDRATQEVEGLSPETRQSLADSLERVEGKLANLRRLMAQPDSPREFAEALSQCDAHYAAANYLREYLDSPGKKDEVFTLMLLIKQTNAIDSFYQRLSESLPVEASKPQLYHFAFEKYSCLLDEAARTSVPRAQKAIEMYPESYHRLDYQTYLGDAYRYMGALETLRIDEADKAGDAAARFSSISSAIENYEKAIATDRAILAELEKSEDAKPPVWAPEIRDRYAEMAREHIEELDRLLAALRLL